MRIATFNVNGIASRLNHLVQWLEKERPDAVCLQELKSDDRSIPTVELERIGYGGLWMGERAWNGVAILARGVEPVEARRGLPGAASDIQSRYLEAAVGGVLIACLYLPNGNPRPGPKFDYKLAWFDRLLRRAQALKRSGAPVVLAGDFNVVPTDADIYDPTHWRRDALLQPESRARYAKFLRQGWVDALKTLHPDTATYTFWDYFRDHWKRNAGLRIDHMLLSPSLAPRLKAAGVDRWVRGLPKASDHAPVWVELKPASRRRAAGVGRGGARRRVHSDPLE